MMNRYFNISVFALLLFAMAAGYQNCSDVRFARVGNSVNAGNLGELCQSANFDVDTSLGNQFPIQINLGDPIVLSVGSDEAIDEVVWTLPDSTNIAGNNINHTFTTAGIKNVLVSVKTGSCSNAKSTNFVIEVIDGSCPNLGDLSMLAVPNKGVVNQSSIFQITIPACIQVSSIQWNFGDGTPGIVGSLPSINHTYTKPGIYVVTTLIEDNNGNQATLRLPYTVQGSDPLIEDLFISGPSFGLVGILYPFHILTNNSSNIFPVTSVEWDMKDGTNLTGIDINHSYAAPNLYEIEADITDNQSNVKNLKHNIEVVNNPVCNGDGNSIYISGPRVSFVNEEVTFNLSHDSSCWVVSGVLWSFEAGQPQLPPNTHIYANPGIYQVTARASISGLGSRDISTYISVFDVCEEGEFIPYNSTDLICTTCDPGYYQTVGRSCEICENVPADLQIINGSVTVGVAGDPNSCEIICDNPDHVYNPNNQTCEPVGCPPDQIIVGGSCEYCPEGQQPNADQTACEPIVCGADQILVGSSCQTCEPNTVPEGGKCVSCPVDHVEDPSNPGTCRQCPLGEVPTRGGAIYLFCASCPADSIENPEGSCQVCPQGTQANKQTNTCDPVSCSNGAVNPPACDQCPANHSMINGQCVEDLCGAGLYKVNGQCVDVGIDHYSPAEDDLRYACQANRHTGGSGTEADSNDDCYGKSDHYGNDHQVPAVLVNIGEFSPERNDRKFSCTNGPSNSYYTTRGHGGNTCNWSCSQGYYESGGQCVPVPCGGGLYRVNGQCVDVGPLHYSFPQDDTRTECAANRFTTGVGAGADSPLDCKAGIDYYGSNESTPAMLVDIGQYSEYRYNGIRVCTNKPENSVYISRGNGVNECEWECTTGYRPSGNSCVVDSCSNGATNPLNCNQCPSGQSMVNGQCTVNACSNGAINPPACNQCLSNQALISGQCVNKCGPGKYRVNGQCVNVGVNHYSPANNDFRTQCKMNRKTTGSGLGADSIADCLAVVDYYGTNHSLNATRVNVGQYSPNRDDRRLNCSNKPAHSVYTSRGNGMNACSWTCSSGYQRVGNSCVVASCNNGATNPPSCNQCPSGYSLVNGQCTVNACTNGATNPPSCNQCASGQSMVNGQCTVNACTNGATNPPSCNQCPSGYSLVNGQCTVNACTNGATNPPSCNQCPSGYSMVNGQCTIQVSCPSGTTHMPGQTTNDTYNCDANSCCKVWRYEWEVIHMGCQAGGYDHPSDHGLVCNASTLGDVVGYRCQTQNDGIDWQCQRH